MNAQAMVIDHETSAPDAKPRTGQVIKTDAAKLMDVITRAAKDPSIDVGKLDHLMKMYERIEASSAKQAFTAAMNEAQTAMRPISANAENSQTHSRYATYDALDRAVRPIYSSHGFTLSFDTGEGAPADHVRVLCMVEHTAGHSRTHHMDIPADGKGAKGGDVMTKTHAAGSAVSYGKRYLLIMIFNLAIGRDDDGNAAGGRGDLITETQVSDLVALIDEVGADRKRFLDFLRIETLAHLPARHFQEAVRALEAKRRA